MRCEWDTLGDTCLECLLAKQMPGEDLYDILQREARIAEPGPVCDLWAQVNEVPVWVDYEQIARGQKVFYRYGGAALTGRRALAFLLISGLCYQSLIGGMAAQRITEVLSRRTLMANTNP